MLRFVSCSNRFLNGGLTVLAVLGCACGGSGNSTNSTTTPIDPSLVGPLSASLTNAAASVSSQAPQDALAAEAVAVSIQAGVQVSPVTLTASQLASAGAGHESALTNGTAKAFGFQLTVLHLAGSSGPETFSGVFVFQDASDWVLAAGPSPSSPIPPGVGILDVGGEQWFATTGGSESAQLATTLGACPNLSSLPSSIQPAVTACNLATFTNAGFNIPATSVAPGGTTGSSTHAASLAAQSLSGGISLTIDCALATVCPGGSSGGGTPANFSSLSVGGVHSGIACGLADGGALAGAAYCWGDNSFGQLGNGSTSNSSKPVPVSGGLTFSQVSVGDVFACGLSQSGAAYCWGFGGNGELGNGSTGASTAPVAVDGGLTFAQVSAGHVHACGLTASGAAYCWGDNTSGELGNGSTASSTVPVAVSGGLTFAEVSAGQVNATCGVTDGGAAYCWGDNYYGELGDGSIYPNSLPVPVSGGLTFAHVRVGTALGCGVTTSGAAYCWGDNTYGELGNGSTTSSRTPVAVGGGLTFEDVSPSFYSACGVTTSGAAYCWGNGTSGELGNGATANSSTPVAVSGGFSFQQVAAAYSFACGLTNSGAAYCWGDDGSGELGDGSTVNSSTPVPVTE